VNERPIVGLTLGDMTGIGPEICARLLASGAGAPHAHIVVIGDPRVLSLGARDAGVTLAIQQYPAVADVDWDNSAIPLLNFSPLDPATVTRGQVSSASGRAVGQTLEFAVNLALSGAIDAVSFAPLNKAALHQGGWDFHDEHQLFAHLTHHTGFFGEMNIIREFSTFRVTSHVSLREALALITKDRVLQAILLAHDSLKAMGRQSPRLGIAALNPHGGEGGLFGDEESRLIRPAIDAARGRNIQCTGPVPADTIFLRAQRGEFDGVVTMYHDQGQIATKLLGFNRGVTMTAGLKVVFTTPAHGTAFDIVGRGQADTGALEQALKVAAQVAAYQKTIRPA
jgi:4-hydroxythreonine-4-phosphate dehydrogenase